MKNISVISEKDCTGCLSCYNSCIHNGISTITNEEGFVKPFVKSDVCTNCGVCLQRCPVNSNKKPNDEQENIPIVYAFKNAKEFVRENSSSGGFFYELSAYVIENGGIIYGAKFDNNYNVIHSSFSNIKEIDAYQSSKYTQSYIGTTFRDCEKQLKNDRLVLFSGTPCQIAGLLSYLGNDYDNLITVDLICHGVPSPKMWQNYLKYQKEQFNSYINKINFRHKQYGWKNYCLRLEFENNIIYLSKNDIDCYMNIFLDDICSRESCYNCHFKGINRQSDFTIGDLWGAEIVCSELDDNKGLSIIFLQSQKAKRIFEKISKNCMIKCLSENQIKKAVEINSSMIKSSIRPKQRDDLINYLNDSTIFKTYNNIPRCTVGILNHVFSNNNYGALLVAFAMEKIVSEYGYTPVNIYLDLEEKHSEVFDYFRNKYLNVTKPMQLNELDSLNNIADTFIIGSDQVWRNWWRTFDVFKVFFASFANYTKNIIAYAASFGISEFPEDQIIKAKIKNLLSSFNAISVREKSGVDILKNDFGFYSEHVLDPTLLINKSYYEKIINDTKKINTEKFITVMIFPGESSDTQECHKAIKLLSESLKIQTNYIFSQNKQLSFSEWLYYISNSELNIVDSFHGLLFSIIFHKNFVCITNAEGGNERFYSILELCGLKEKLLDCNCINNQNLKKIADIQIDWNDVENRMSKAKEKSRIFIENALMKTVSYNSKILYQETENLNEKETKRSFLSNIKHFIKRCIKKCIKILKKIIKFIFQKHNKSI